MSFRLIRPETIDVTVDVQPPGGAAGQVALKVRYLTIPQRRDLIEEIRGSADESTTDAGLAQRLVVGWDGVEDARGEPVPWSTGALASAMELPYFHSAVTDALMEHIYGARAKNFVAPAASGLPARTQ